MLTQIMVEKWGNFYMRHRMQWRYFAVLLIPLVMILSIAVALISMTHNQGVAAMRKDVETNRMLLTQKRCRQPQHAHRADPAKLHQRRHSD